MTDLLDPVNLDKSTERFARTLVQQRARRDAEAPDALTASANAITASAAPLKDPTGRAGDRARKKDEGWQAEAWRYRDQLGIVAAPARFVGGSLSRCRLIPAITLTPGTEPVPLDTETDEGLIVPETVAASCEALLASFRSDEQDQGQMLASYGENDFVAGESIIVGRDRDGTPQWDLYSTSEVVPHPSHGWVILDSPNQPPSSGEHLVVRDGAENQAIVFRLWNPHPRWRKHPDSSVRASLDVLEELQILTRTIRATALSRLPAGIFLVPTSALKGGAVASTETVEQAAQKKMLAIANHMSQAVGDPASAEAIVPYLLAMDGEDIDKAKIIDVFRAVDKVFGEQRAELIKRYSWEVDLPPERITGIADLNHWSAWQVSEDEFRSYLAPRLRRFCAGVTSNWWRAALTEAGIDDPRIVVWYDASAIIADPDRTESATDGVKLGLVSPPTWRRSAGFSEEDAPNEEEVAYLKDIGVLGQTVETIDVEEGPPVTAAATPGLDRLGDKLAATDRALFDRLLQACDDQMRRALERAGARMKSKLTASNPSMRDTLKGVAPERIGQVAGEAMVAAAGLSEDELLEASFDGLKPRWDAWVAAAYESAFDAADTYTDTTTIRAEAEDDSEAGWLLLLAMLLAAARVELYGHGRIEPDGETDPTTVVAPSIVRQALARAGGANLGPGVTVTPTGVPTAAPTAAPGGGLPLAPGSGLVATGENVIRALASGGIRVTARKWSYGASIRSSFKPHLDLDGEEFTDWDDPKVLWQGWPGYGHLFPGDHKGCQCTTVPVLDYGNTLN